jgi:hypothetical protein
MNIYIYILVIAEKKLGIWGLKLGMAVKGFVWKHLSPLCLKNSTIFNLADRRERSQSFLFMFQYWKHEGNLHCQIWEPEVMCLLWAFEMQLVIRQIIWWIFKEFLTLLGTNLPTRGMLCYSFSVKGNVCSWQRSTIVYLWLGRWLCLIGEWYFNKTTDTALSYFLQACLYQQ